MSGSFDVSDIDVLQLWPRNYLPPAVGVPEALGGFPAAVTVHSVVGKVRILACIVCATTAAYHTITILADAITTIRVGGIWVVATLTAVNKSLGGVRVGWI